MTVNLGFEDEAPSPNILRLFNTSDLGALSDFGCEVVETTLSRSLRIDAKTLNAVYSLRDGKVHVHLNFHDETRSAEDALRVLKGHTAKCFDVATRFLATVYGTKIEET